MKRIVCQKALENRQIDVDFKERVIHVRGTLVYSETKGYYKTSPKTRTSKRDIPMLDNVYTILQERKKDRQN